MNGPLVNYLKQELKENNTNYMAITNTTTPFKIWVEINPVSSLWGVKSGSGIKLHLQRDSVGLLMGSFFVPTGIFAILSIGSYVINPDIVSFILHRFCVLLLQCWDSQHLNYCFFIDRGIKSTVLEIS